MVAEQPSGSDNSLLYARQPTKLSPLLNRPNCDQYSIIFCGCRMLRCPLNSEPISLTLGNPKAKRPKRLRQIFIKTSVKEGGRILTLASAAGNALDTCRKRSLEDNCRILRYQAQCIGNCRGCSQYLNTLLFNDNKRNYRSPLSTPDDPDIPTAKKSR